MPETVEASGQAAIAPSMNPKHQRHDCLEACAKEEGVKSAAKQGHGKSVCSRAEADDTVAP